MPTETSSSSSSSSPATKPTQWKTLPSMTVQRVGAGGVCVNDDQFLVLGGDDDYGNNFSSCEYYDKSKKTWKKFSPDLPEPRADFGVAKVRDRVYVLGGRTGADGSKTSAGVVSIDVSGGDLSATPAAKWKPREPMASKRYSFACVSDSKRYIYVFGGRDGDDKVSVTSERYDTETDRWEPLQDSMPTERAGCAAGICGTKIYVVGGQDENGRYLASVDVFDTTTQKWESSNAARTANDDDDDDAGGQAKGNVKPATTGKVVPDMNESIAGGSVVVADHFVIVMGGEHFLTTETRSIKVLDTQLNAWNNSRLSMNTKRSYFAAGIWKNNREVVVAGGREIDAEETISFEDGILPAAYSVREYKDYEVRDEKSTLSIKKREYILRKGQGLKRDSEDGEDLLNLDTIARIFAEHLASKSLVPPFVLGILGNWGSGKSFFFNLIKQDLIKIQKKNDARFVDKMYLIRFSAWTYSKDSLWASMMFRIFRDLSCQMELEEKIEELEKKRTIERGEISIIELYDKLSFAEREYFKDLKGRGLKDFVKDVRRIKSNENQASKPFVEIFKPQMSLDQEELKKAEKELENAAKKNVWVKAIEDYKEERNGEFSNAFRDVVVKEMKTQQKKMEKYKDIQFNEMTDKYLEQQISDLDFRKRLWIRTIKLPWMRVKICCKPSNAIQEYLAEEMNTYIKKNTEMLNKGLEKNFGDLSPLIRSLAYVKSSPSVFIFLLLFILAVVVAAILFRETVIEFWKSIVVFVPVVLAPFVQAWMKVKQNLKEFSNEFSNEIKQVTSFVSDIETNLRSDSDQSIQTSKKKILNIKHRLKVLEGESLQQVVNDRIKSNLYLEELGILHQAQEDLFNLSEAMHNKYSEEYKEARIVLFIDDLDRCEPQKVMEVLEAMQLLVKSELFVVVVTIDSRYVCLSLENIQKYKNILQDDRSPTGMDFLRKIIQVPFRLPAMSDDAIQRYVKDHANVDRGNESNPPLDNIYLADGGNSPEDGGNRDEATSKDAPPEDNVNHPETMWKTVRNWFKIRRQKETSSNQNDDAKNSYSSDDDSDRTVTHSSVAQTQAISEEGLQDLKDVCEVFQMGPRTIKYLINVYNLMTRIRKEDNRRNENWKGFKNWKGFNVGRISLFLIAMASCENTREGIEKLFNAMESKEKPFENKDKSFESGESLYHIVCGLCPGMKPSQKDVIKQEFGLPIANVQEWEDFCTHFELARCFSFNHIIKEPSSV